MEFNPYRKITHPPAKTLIKHVIKISLTITEIGSGLEHYPPANKGLEIFQKILKTSIKIEKIIDEVKLIELKSRVIFVGLPYKIVKIQWKVWGRIAEGNLGNHAGDL